MSKVTDFYTGIQGAIDNAVSRLKPYRVAVSSTSNGLVKIQPLESPTPLAEGYARLTGTKLESGDEVAIIELSGKPFVLGKIQRSSPNGEAFDFPIQIEADSAQALEVSDGVSPTLIVDTDSGVVTGSSFNSPVVTTIAQSSADTTSTTSTTTLQTACTTTLNLPIGSWTLKAVGGCQFTHSSSGTVLFQVTIASTGGTARSMTFNNSVYGHGVDNAEVGGLSGSVTISLDYRCSTAGTTSARNPWLLIIATRTS